MVSFSGHTRRRRQRLGSIPNAATVAFKQNINSPYVLLNAATAKKYMLNKSDPIFHGGRTQRRRRTTRKN